jgi:hypothetical protein
MPNLVGPTQTAFIKGRSIMDTFLVAREALILRNNLKIHSIVLKVDFRKTFDTISWEFLMGLLKAKGFLEKWITCLLNTFLVPGLQFADDTLIISEAHPFNLQGITRVLEDYGRMTGLVTNPTKSTFATIHIPQNLIPTVEKLLGCKAKPLPMKYLGLPLTIKKPTKDLYLPLLASLQHKLASWKGSMLSKGGRLILINSVLNALPIYFMQAFILPSWFIKHVERTKMRFFWKGQTTPANGGILIAWANTCLPKIHGGLGIIDLKMINTALTLKWLWHIYAGTNSLLGNFVREHYNLPCLLLNHEDNIKSMPSFFLRDIMKNLQFFRMATSKDNGELTWRFTVSGQFTSNSAYKTLINPGECTKAHSLNWKVKAPLKVKIFVWALLKDRIATKVNLNMRGGQFQDSCVLCHTPTPETTTHLFLTCTFARSLWSKLAPRAVIRQQDNVQAFWTRNRLNFKSEGCNAGDTLVQAFLWALWRERNRRVFSGLARPLDHIELQIATDYEAWKKYC